MAKSVDPKIIYEELLKIKKGSVISYRELARRVGREAAIRRVATIVGQNTKPIKIPCHRIIKTNGELGEYTYEGKRNPQKKMEILATEGVFFEKQKTKSGKVVYRLKHTKKGAIL